MWKNYTATSRVTNFTDTWIKIDNSLTINFNSLPYPGRNFTEISSPKFYPINLLPLGLLYLHYRLGCCKMVKIAPFAVEEVGLQNKFALVLCY
jgi:hypothetical protein